MIRQLIPTDRDQFAALMMEFYDERVKDIGIEMTKDKCLEHFDLYIGLPNVFGLVYEKDGTVVGVILMTISQMMGSGVRLAQEIVWYVNKDNRSCGVRLLRNMEIFLRNNGCQHIMMIGLEGDRSCDFYERSGYKLFQKSYIKRLV